MPMNNRSDPSQETQSHRVPDDDSITPLKNAEEGSVKIKQARIIEKGIQHLNISVSY